MLSNKSNGSAGFRFRWRGDDKLRIVPHEFEGRNAYFDKDRRAVLLGYFPADSNDPGANLPGQMKFTCLSVDVVAHEVTHAIVHRMRKYFSEPTHPDVLAWHEAFADLVALFNHFGFPEVVADAVEKSEGTLEQGSALLDLATEFGASTGRGAALRSAIGSPRTPDAFLQAVEPHDRGACFIAAVFDAFIDTYKSQIADLRRIASAGTGVLPPGALPTDLVQRVTAAAAVNADRFLGMVVRAFEYLPVVDVTFGDVVRADCHRRPSTLPRRRRTPQGNPCRSIASTRHLPAKSDIPRRRGPGLVQTAARPQPGQRNQCRRLSPADLGSNPRP